LASVHVFSIGATIRIFLTRDVILIFFNTWWNNLFIG
jgi:hypothetical protein